MSEKKETRVDSITRFEHLLQKQMCKAVRPYRADGYINLLTRYGTSKDSSEAFKFQAEPMIPDETLTIYYEGNGLFAKIIDTPAEEAIKHGFKMEGVVEEEVSMFVQEALDELDWEETAMTAIKWARLFGGAIAVMLINDGRGLEEPVDWKHIKSIDDIRVYDRSVVQPDYNSMFSYEPDDPFRTRGSRLGKPEFYFIYSRYGSFTVHESRCLVFENGILPENTTSSVYQLWGMPEYVRIQRALRDAEVAHRSAPKMLDRSVQPVYKMKDMSAELSTEDGEDKILRRIQTIDMARGMMNTIVVDKEGEDYDFRTFQYSGVSDVIDSACNMLSALTNIPQTILFGRSPAGMNSTGESDFENYYNFIERIQKKMLRSNLRYLISVILQAGVATGEIQEVPKFKVQFLPLWSLSELERADLESKKAATELTKAQTIQAYVEMQALDPTEVRKKLAENNEFAITDIIDPDDYEEDLMAMIEEEFPEENEGNVEGSTPVNAPTATKLPQDMTEEEQAEIEKNVEHESENEDDRQDESDLQSVAVFVVKEGKVLCGTRHNDFGYGLICGPGGHMEDGEEPETTAARETEEEFGIVPTELIYLGRGPQEPDTGLTPYLYLCTEYLGEPEITDLEIVDIEFRTLEDLYDLRPSLFQPFADGLDVLMNCIGIMKNTDSKDVAEIEPNAFVHIDELHEEKPKVSKIKTGSGFFKKYLRIIENFLDFSGKKGTIKSGILSKDGAPHGNKNAAGPHKRQHLSEADKSKYSKRIVGQTTSDGVTVKQFSGHAFDRIAQRNLSPKRIEDMLKSDRVSVDKNHPDTRRCYDVKGSRLVLDHTNGTIVTIEWRSKNK